MSAMRGLTEALGRILTSEPTLTVNEFEAAFEAAVREVVDRHEHATRVVQVDDNAPNSGHAVGEHGERVSVIHVDAVAWKEQATA